MEPCCDRGEAIGIWFNGGQRVCPRHYTPEQAELVRGVEQRGTAIGLRRDTETGQLEWPYGPNIDVPVRVAMLEWAEAHGLQYTAGHQVLRCVCWPTSNRRSRCECGHMDVLYQRPDATWDHFTHWKTRDGKRAVLVVQPYNVTDAGKALLDQWNEREDVQVEIRKDSWYGHGTTFIGIWNAQFAPSAAAQAV